MKYLVAGVKENHRLTVFIEIKKIAASKSTTTSTSTHNHNYNQIYVQCTADSNQVSNYFGLILLTNFYSLFSQVGPTQNGLWLAFLIFLQFCKFTVHGTLYIFSQMLMFQSIARLGWSEIDGNMALLFFLSA